MSHRAVVCVLTIFILHTAFPSAAQQAAGQRTAVAVEADKNDSPAAMLAEALRGQIQQSATYQLAPSAKATVVIHIVGLAIPNCRPTSAIAVSYVSLPMETHLGTAVLTTDKSRVTTSARDVLTKLPQMMSAEPRPR